jgi:major capsid protein
MSLSPQKLEPVEVRYPVSILQNKRDFAVLRNGSQTTFKQFTTTSISSSSLQFTCPPPAGNIIVSRKQYFTLPMRVVLTGTVPANGFLIQLGHDAPRAFPIASIMDTVQVTINNQSVSINSADIIQALLRFNTDLKLKTHDYSMTPSCLDQSQQYSDLFGGIRNPLGSYVDSNDEGVMGRGGFPFTIVSNPQAPASPPTSTLTAVIDMVVTEPLFLSPFYWGHGNASGFYNVNTMDYNITFIGNTFARVWSHDNQSGANATNITSGQVLFNNFTSVNATPFSYQQNQPVMLFEYITPQETQVLSPNMPLTYPYFDVQRYPTNSGVAAAAFGDPSGNDFQIINSNNIQLNSIPRRMYVYVRQQNQDLYSNPNNTDTFFQINQLSIQFLNKNGLLASASPYQLYEMSVGNHLNMSWTQWNGPTQIPGGTPPTPGIKSANAVGSVICIEFAKDIGLEALEAPGKNQQCMLQMQVNCRNLRNAVINPTLYIVAVLDGTFTIEGLGRASTNVGVITSQDILDAKSKPFLNWKDVEDVNGGNFFDGIKQFFTDKVLPLIKESRIASNLANLIPVAGPAISKSLKNLGYGDGVYAGEGDGVYAGEGGVVLGGAKMSRAQMRRRLIQ